MILRRQERGTRRLGATAIFWDARIQAGGLAYLFGSTARGESGAASDIDLFIDYHLRSRFSLVELVGIKQLLERRLGVPVDMTTRDSVDPLLRDRIEASAERVL